MSLPTNFFIGRGAGGGGGLYDFTSHTFTNADSFGYNGPTSSNTNAAYSGQPFMSEWFVNRSGIQLLTIPTDADYQFVIAGARGGWAPSSSREPGYGRIARATFALTAGTVIGMLVGQKGGSATISKYNSPPPEYSNGVNHGFPSQGYEGSGGGGTFLFINNNGLESFDGTNLTESQLLMVAGGGGGVGESENGTDGATTTSGSQLQPIGGGGGAHGLAGSNGYAGETLTPYYGMGGAGWQGDATDITNSGYDSDCFGGHSLKNGGHGAVTNISGPSSNGNYWLCDGGFGGGGYARGASYGGGGGGGGFSGGCAGIDYAAGGGGGSYIKATATNDSFLGTHGEHGYVQMTQVA